MIHLEGMGVIGCLLALDLDQYHIPFTWHDTNEAVAAWPACTGCIYPCGDFLGRSSYNLWSANYYGLRTDEYQQAPYWYLSKTPPHDNKWKAVRQIDSLKLAPEASYHINAQRVVDRVRAQFADRRRSLAPDGARLIRAHGYGPRLHHYLWGWSREVDLPGLRERLDCPDQPCVNLQEGRFKMRYVYPRPGTGHWYAGSALIRQTYPKRLDAESKYVAWAEHIWKHLAIQPVPKGECLMGWRPVSLLEDHDISIEDDVISVPPLSHSGVRLAPLVTASVVRALSEPHNHRRQHDY